MADLIAALHQSASDTRLIVYDREGNKLTGQRVPLSPSASPDGTLEYDPAEIWRHTGDAVGRALSELGRPASALAAVGIAAQRETTVVWNKHTAKPYAPAIAGPDRRSAGQMAALLRDGQSELIHKKTGLVPDALFSAGKLSWLLRHVDGLRADAEAGEALFGTMDSWLVWNLTGRHVTDVTSASRTMLLNLDTEDWDDELLALFGIPRAMLPQVAPSSTPDRFGTTAGSGPFGMEVPVTGVLGEHQAALFGQHCFLPGQARYGFEGSSALLVNTGTTRADTDSGLLGTIAYRLAGEPAVYALEGFVPYTGATVQWLVDGLGIIRGVGEIEAMSRRADDPEGLYFVPAFTGLALPRPERGARGAILGMDTHHNQNHVARATLQALAYQLRDLIEAMREGTGHAPTQLRVDGNGAWFDMCMQIHADVLGIQLRRPADVADTAALGAAHAAGLAVGVWADLAEVAGTRRENHRWSAQWMPEDRERGYAGWRSALERTAGWVEEATLPQGDWLATLTAAQWRADGSR
ncbi:FGGY family carbohydrate kinase [Streptomyces iranensis]|uniref:ATP:glycerol 3-phosphotransferase n=1 Tax=Streptomyces iranensis TaxID=576784 RepID=A0A061A5Y4_9ACTN|nr:glycerol kinase GlpK [Streptomyces iranensis]MBP2067672.1 glycerol kinase [Streptomyces iranensis]CDR18230.1 Carbohydrate kinase, FGGY [Streptomyces iranensis]